ncbi:MAG TPA: PIN domain-containing protein [Candidatus Limnocylindrales bacterium]|nr:PIN domain-containing protein [Candidatus Limnocylindrales bacterium]
MRLLVDSTVFIDFFRGRETAQTSRLEQCFQNGDEICYCGFVLLEVLQGIRDEKELVTVKHQFENLIYLEDDRSTFELGATIYRELRRRGITIRNSVDCLIAATVIQHGVNFLENDRDYKFIDQHYPLNRI